MTSGSNGVTIASRSYHLSTLAENTLQRVCSLHSVTHSSSFHKRADIIPRDAVFGFPISIVTILYWYTRRTTSGISTIGTVGIVAGFIIHQIGSLIHAGHDENIGWEEFALHLIGMAWEIIPAFLMIRLIFPVVLVKDARGWSILRSSQSHRERASRRVDDQVSWATRGGVSNSF